MLPYSSVVCFNACYPADITLGFGAKQVFQPAECGAIRSGENMMRAGKIVQLTGVIAGLVLVLWPTLPLNALPRNMNANGLASPPDPPHAPVKDRSAASLESLQRYILNPYPEDPLPLQRDDKPAEGSENAEDPLNWIREHVVWLLVGGGVGCYMLYAAARYFYQENYVKPQERQRKKDLLARVADRKQAEKEKNAGQDEHDSQCEWLRQQLDEKKTEIRRKMDIDELQVRFVNAEAEVVSERRARSGEVAAKSEPPVAPHLSDKQVEALALKAHIRFGLMPANERLGATLVWRTELNKQYGSLVAGEVIQQLNELSALS